MNRGLIEARLLARIALISLSLPRFMNRGLIEAFPLIFRVFGVLELPRFMNRGLIEAGPRARSTRTSDYFPDS